MLEQFFMGAIINHCVLFMFNGLNRMAVLALIFSLLLFLASVNCILLKLFEILLLSAYNITDLLAFCLISV